jgi:hypothetical protein
MVAVFLRVQQGKKRFVVTNRWSMVDYLSLVVRRMVSIHGLIDRDENDRTTTPRRNRNPSEGRRKRDRP